MTHETSEKNGFQKSCQEALGLPSIGSSIVYIFVLRRLYTELYRVYSYLLDFTAVTILINIKQTFCSHAQLTTNYSFKYASCLNTIAMLQPMKTKVTKFKDIYFKRINRQVSVPKVVRETDETLRQARSWKSPQSSFEFVESQPIQAEIPPGQVQPERIDKPSQT